MESRPRAVLIDRGEEQMELLCAYNREFIDALKLSIPAGERWWDADLRVWMVDRAAKEELVYLLPQFYRALDTESLRRVVYKDRVVTAPCSHGAFGELFLLPGAPQDLIDAAYRVLAKRCHPDRGGTNEAMTRVNLAYERLRVGR